MATLGIREMQGMNVGGLANRRPGEVIHSDGGTLREREEQELARFLGWFSLGLGAVEVLAPRALARAIGIRDELGLLPLFGWRELVSGIGILTQRRPASWLWARVAGDVMDLAYLASQATSNRTDSTKLAVAATAVAGVTLLDVLAAEQHSEHPRARSAPRARPSSVHVCKAITVNRTANELYEFWRRIENFPTFMRHLKSVERKDERTSHWVAFAPAGRTVEWDSEITEDHPGERLAWKSLGGDIDHSGTVSFRKAPGDRGTEVFVELNYRPPYGVAAAMIANLFGEEPEFQIQEDLRHLKQFLETGEVAKTEGQPTGRGGRSMLPF